MAEVLGNGQARAVRAANGSGGGGGVALYLQMKPP
jgi:hypothetical protein